MSRLPRTLTFCQFPVPSGAMRTKSSMLSEIVTSDDGWKSTVAGAALVPRIELPT